jgi:hypothetical protein
VWVTAEENAQGVPARKDAGCQLRLVQNLAWTTNCSGKSANLLHFPYKMADSRDFFAPSLTTGFCLPGSLDGLDRLEEERPVRPW